MKSNPIQQRIEMMADQWEETRKHVNARLVRIVCAPDEHDMVDTFYTYMIAADSLVPDIVFHFDAVFADVNTYSHSLLSELEEVITIWNNSKKDDRIEFVPIDWKANYSMTDPGNPASLFVNNFNALAAELNLPKDLYAVAVFRNAVADKRMIQWLDYALKSSINAGVRLLIHDFVTAPCFDLIRRKYSFTTADMRIQLDMPKAMEQIAAMGDPNDPGTAYRLALMKMMNAMASNKEAEAEQFGRGCIGIANANLSKDPYWIMQLVAISIVLGNDKIRYKKKKDTVAYADKAVEAATAAQAFFANGIAMGLLAQAGMFRGTVHFIHGNNRQALPDFKSAFEIYCQQGNLVLAAEAARMAGRSAFNISDDLSAIKILAAAARLGEKIDRESARASSYPGVLEMLLKYNHQQEISKMELNQIGQSVFGKDWVKLVMRWKQQSNEHSIAEQKQAAVQVRI